MSRDWRIMICTRYRPLAIVVIVIVVWALSITSLMTIGLVQERSWDLRLARVTVGTTRSRLIEILGQPQGTERIKSNEIQWMRGLGFEELEKTKREHPELVKYFYYKTFFGMNGPVEYSVYLDENEERTVTAPNMLPFWVGLGNPLMVAVLLSLVFLAFIVWLCFRAWCIRNMRSPRSSLTADQQLGR